jgi:hypothetical protein
MSNILDFEDLYARSQQNPEWAGASRERVAQAIAPYNPSGDLFLQR